jgi:hypothetical protein
MSYADLKAYLEQHPHADGALVLCLAGLCDDVELYCDDVDGTLRDARLHWLGLPKTLHWMPEFGFGGDEQLVIGMLWIYLQEIEAALGANPVQEAAHALSGLLGAMELQEKRELGLFHLTATSARAVWGEAKQVARTWLKRRGFIEDDRPRCARCQQPLAEITELVHEQCPAVPEKETTDG